MRAIYRKYKQDQKPNQTKVDKTRTVQLHFRPAPSSDKNKKAEI